MRIFRLKQALFNTANVMILLGALVGFLGLNGAWRHYRANHSVIDMVVTSPTLLDLTGNLTHAPRFTPTLTPFQPSDPVALQPQNNNEGSGVPVTENLADIAGAAPAAAPARTNADSSSRVGWAPDRLVIPAISLDAPVVPIHYQTVEYLNQTLEQWLVPNTFAAGWHDTSALLGLPGNTVLNGHHNAYGEVFKDLIYLEQEDIIEVYSGEAIFRYEVVAKMLFQERFLPVEERIANAAWILPSRDERLTLISCWPPDSNTERIVIVAFPVNQ